MAPLPGLLLSRGGPKGEPKFEACVTIQPENRHSAKTPSARNISGPWFRPNMGVFCASKNDAGMDDIERIGNIAQRLEPGRNTRLGACSSSTTSAGRQKRHRDPVEGRRWP